MKDAPQSGHTSVATTAGRSERPAKVPVANNNCSRTRNNNTGLPGHGKSATRDNKSATRDSSVDDDGDSDDWDFGIRNLVIDLDADLDVRSSACAASESVDTTTTTADNKGDGCNKMSGVEHHSTVDKGLKMKIKRKNVAGGKSSDSKADTVKENNKSQQGGGSNTWNSGASNGNTNSSDRGLHAGVLSSTPDKQSERLKHASQVNSNVAQADAKLAKARVMHKRERVKDKSTRGAGENGECDSGCSSSGSSSVVSLGGAAACTEAMDSDVIKREQDAKLMSDPYEFNAKVEDRFGLPVKKVKGEKVSTVGVL